MQILGGTLARYFGLRFLSAVLLVFVGIFALVALLDYVELMRRTSDIRECRRRSWWPRPRSTACRR